MNKVRTQLSSLSSFAVQPRNSKITSFLSTPQIVNLSFHSLAPLPSHKCSSKPISRLSSSNKSLFYSKLLLSHSRPSSTITMSPIMNVLIAGGTIASVGLGVLFAFQERILYHPDIPTRKYEMTPTEFAMRYSDVEILTDDSIKLHAWLVKTPNSTAVPTFVYFHGNAGNIGHRLSDIRQFVSEGYNVLCVSYRGYGKSEGSPSEWGIRLDAVAALKYLRDRNDVIDTSRIFLFGRSIGGAAAISLAANPETQGLVRGLVVENTFTSIDDMIDCVMPFLKFAKPFNRNKWASIKDIGKIDVPILFLSGAKDELVPPHHMKKLEELATKARFTHFHTVPTGGHNNTWYLGGSAYRRAIRMFTEKTLNGS